MTDFDSKIEKALDLAYRHTLRITGVRLVERGPEVGTVRVLMDPIEDVWEVMTLGEFRKLEGMNEG